MCLPAVPLLIAAGTAVSAMGQIQSGIYASKVARNQALVAGYNKAIKREQVGDTIEQGQRDQLELGREIAQRVGQQTARISANNIDPGFGSASRVVEDTLMLGREDQSALAENTRRQVRSLQTDIWNYEVEKRAARAQAKQATTAAVFGAASTILGGATQYAKFKAGR
jgi:RNA-binding protein YlmH